jgi:tetratricopeptide (TPR) repeat protein
VKALYRAWETAGDISAHAGAVRDSRDHYQHAVAYSDRYATLAAADPAAIALAARAQSSLAATARRQGDKMAALEGFRKSLELNQAWELLEPDGLPARRAIANSHERLGLSYQELGDLRRSEEHSVKALALVEAIAALPEANLRDRERVAGACQRAGDVHGHARMANTGNYRLARRYYSRKNEIYAAMAKADPHDAQAREEWAFSWYELGNTWRDENPALAAGMYGRALEFAEPAARKEATVGMLWSFVGQLRTVLAYATFRQGRRDEGVAMAKQAVEILEKVAAVPGGPAGEKHHLAAAHASLAALLAESGNATASAAQYRRAAELVRPLADRHDAGAEAALAAWLGQAGAMERRLSKAPAPASAGSGE